MELFDRIVNPALLVRRLTITANRVIDEDGISAEPAMEQLDLFTDIEAVQAQKEIQATELEREKRLQKTMLGIKNKYGKNAILKGTNLMDGATTMERNLQIGGHRA